jgi:CubicO group peptidase (beta-lactamase class C family)
MLRALGLVLFAVIVAALLYAGITFPPVMAGMAAKTMCSCMFVGGRTEASVREKELKVFPGLSRAGMDIDLRDSTVSATIFWKTSKAIFRNGLGCTLLATASEEQVRAQEILLPPKPRLQDSVSWPSGNMMATERDSARRTLLDNVVAKGFQDAEPGRPKNTSAIIVVHEGKIIAERYAVGVDRNARLMGWSMTKSITNALIGILVQDKKLTLEQPAPVPAWKDDERRHITLNNLLQATSGLKWSESYFIPTSSFHDMFIRSDDKAAYAESMQRESAPGEVYEYSSGTTNILSAIIRRTVGDEEYYKLPYEKLFYKIGMNRAVIEPDASGTFVASSYSWATARGWARFGMLYLNDGVWNGERILPEGWVRYTSTPSSAATRGEYGAQWHLNAGASGNVSIRKYPNLPADAFWADGFEEQWVMVIPSKKLVVVRLGISHHGAGVPVMVEEILQALR